MACTRQGLSVADVLRDHVSGLHLDHEQRKAVAHILACRTGRLGGHLAVCNRCGARHYAYHSCRDRHCPRCGGLDQHLWAEAQLPHLLPVSYFHLVFTVPVSLRRFFAGPFRRYALDALFAAVAESILETTARQGLVPGILAVLHTWNQQMGDHPHVHCLVTGGGLGPQDFVYRRRYLVHLASLQTVFQGKLLHKLQTLLREGRVNIPSHNAHQRLRHASRRTWNIHIRYRDRRDHNRLKTASSQATTFCRSFLQHVLPAGFVRIRRYGLLSNRLRKPMLERCRKLLGAEPPLLMAPPGESRVQALRRPFGFQTDLCPDCKLGRLVVVAEWTASRLPLNLILSTLIPRAP